MKRVDEVRSVEAARLFFAHALLFFFTLLLVAKLDGFPPSPEHPRSAPWWLVFSPLWVFHLVVAPWRFSIPAPSGLHQFHWPPFHSSVANPLLFAFEVLLFVHLEISHAVNLKVVFFPFVLLEILIILDNLRMWVSLQLEDMGDSSVNVKWKKIIHCSIILSMTFIVAATMIMVRMLSDDTATRNWWLPCFVFSIGEFFAFLVCTKWTPMIDRYSQTSTTTNVSGEEEEEKEKEKKEDDDDSDVGMLDNCSQTSKEEEDDDDDNDVGMLDNYSQTSTITDVEGEEGEGEEDDSVVEMLDSYSQPSTSTDVAKGGWEDDKMLGNKGSLQDIGGYAMKALIVVFQLLLCMRVQGTLAIAREIPFRIIFSSLLLLQGLGVVVSLLLMLEIKNYSFIPKARDLLEFILHGSRLLGWWSLHELEPLMVFRDNASRDRLKFLNTPPSALEKMSKKDLVDEVWTLQVGCNILIEATKSTKLKHDLLIKNEVLCLICTKNEIEVLLHPCNHWNVCRSCCIGRRVCPTCHRPIVRQYILDKVYQKLLL